MAFKLLVEKPDLSEFEYIVEEKNSKEPSKLFIQGPFMMASEKNRNNVLASVFSGGGNWEMFEVNILSQIS